MPLYEYECQSCGRRTETLQRMNEAPLTVCPDCGGPLKKLISAPGIHFKGSGWYVTDYAGKKSSAKGEKSEKGETASANGGSSEGASGSSAETKSEKSKDATPAPPSSKSTASS